MTYSYGFKVTGKTTDGKSLSKSFSDVNSNFCANQVIADGFAEKFVKLYDSGTTLSSVDKISHKVYEVTATAA